MYRKLISISTLIALLVALVSPVGVFADSFYDYFYDFTQSSYATGLSKNNGTVTFGGGVAKITCANTGTAPTETGITQALSAVTDDYLLFSTTLQMPEAVWNSDTELYDFRAEIFKLQGTRDGTNGFFDGVLFNRNGTITKGTVNLGTWEPNQWVEISMIIRDITASSDVRSIEYYRDGILQGNVGGNTLQITDVKQVRIRFYDHSLSLKNAYLDDFRVTNNPSVVPTPPAQQFNIISSIPADGEVNADNASAIFITFEKPVKQQNFSKDLFSLTAGNVEITDAVLDAEGTTCTITLSEALPYSTSCVLTISNELTAIDGSTLSKNTISFTTKDNVANYFNEYYDFSEDGSTVPAGLTLVDGSLSRGIEEDNKYAIVACRNTGAFSGFDRVFPENLVIGPGNPILMSLRIRVPEKPYEEYVYRYNTEIFKIVNGLRANGTTASYNGISMRLDDQQFRIPSSADSIGDLVPGEWIKLDALFEVGAVKYYVNDVHVATDTTNNVVEIPRMRFRVADLTQQSNQVHYDDLRITNNPEYFPTSELHLSSSIPVSGSFDISVKSTVTLNFNKTLDINTVKPDSFSINNGAVIKSAVLTPNLRGVILTFDNLLKPTTTYTVIVNSGLMTSGNEPVSITGTNSIVFTTDTGTLGVSKIKYINSSEVVITDIITGAVTARTTVTNGTNNKLNAVLITLLCKKNGSDTYTVESFTLSDIKEVEASQEIVMTSTVNVPNTSDYIVKSFVWESLGTIKPYSETEILD